MTLFLSLHYLGNIKRFQFNWTLYLLKRSLNSGLFLFLPTHFKTKIMKHFILICSGLFLLISCVSGDEENTSKEEIAAALSISNYSPIILERGGIKLVEFTDFPPFTDVETKIATQNQTFKMGINKIEFKNKYFNLGEKTTEENIQHARLNEGGQYLGVTTPDKSINKVIRNQFETELKKGDNLFFCYLSRSYDLSVKNPKASFLFKVNADPSGCFSETDLKDTLVTLLQPRGIFKYNQGDKILLDFYLKNIVLDNGSFINLTIDKVEFKLTKWIPFWIHGLKSGHHNVSIALITKDGQSIKGVMPQKLSSSFTINEVELFSE